MIAIPCFREKGISGIDLGVWLEVVCCGGIIGGEWLWSGYNGVGYGGDGDV